MTARYHCSNLTEDQVTLSQSESHHAIHVMRMNAGDAIALFDGFGTTTQGEVCQITRREVSVQILSRESHPRPITELCILASPPKGDRLRWMIEKLTELGVTLFRPLISDRTVKHGANRRSDKLSSAVIEAAKQCGRNWLMEIGEPITLEDFSRAAHSSEHRILVAHPGSNVLPPLQSADKTTVLIGPEGGFTEKEISHLQESGAGIVSWPGNTLRTETAAITFAALLKSC